ncbi:TIGR03083 family protein [Pseudonocardia thermophila]|uniref:TIGR03083 family protein n=1 Tax=Pseudonocardia thermophila TaxID=1848 RepID=A0A1M6Q7Y9_PSETH|nr:maleylpyruvate isomerase family mycothiol-dependent enzyme [Pseudonocardia thermophila]SHK16203.1 TIGR03083 family protein [Pseudonocardia thermophila]
MDYSALLLSENAALADLVHGADHTVPVPTCPGWTIRKLAAHIARGDRWAATIIRTRATERVDPRTVPGGEQPADLDAEREWVRGGAQAILDAVAEVGGGTEVWTFTGPKPAAWWIRRRLHEQTVHRADAALALGRPFEIAPELAADGLSEWFDIVASRPESPLPDGATLHLHATDDGLGEDGEWVLRGTPSGVVWEHGHEKADAAVRGTAADLLLAALRRTVDGVEVLGDAEVWKRWLDHTDFA